MNVLKKQKTNKSDAVMTAEACIGFTIFAILTITLLFFIRIVYVHSLVQHCINQAAKEISSYSYIYGVTIMDVDDNLQDVAASGEKYFNTNIGNIVDGVDSIISVGENASNTYDSATSFDIEGTISNAEATGKSYQQLKEQYPDTKASIQELISNPKKFMQSIGSIFAGNAMSDAKAFFGGEIVRAMMSDYLNDMNQSGGGNYEPSERLAKLGIVGGLEGIDFSQSKFNETVNGQKHSIDIVACYKIKPIAPIKVYKEMGMMNKITVRMWVNDND